MAFSTFALLPPNARVKESSFFIGVAGGLLLLSDGTGLEAPPDFGEGLSTTRTIDECESL